MLQPHLVSGFLQWEEIIHSRGHVCCHCEISEEESRHHCEFILSKIYSSHEAMNWGLCIYQVLPEVLPAYRYLKVKKNEKRSL